MKQIKIISDLEYKCFQNLLKYFGMFVFFHETSYENENIKKL